MSSAAANPGPVEVWKDTLYPGTYTLPNGRTVTYSPADVANAVAQGQKMIDAGLHIPVAWDHQANAIPEYLSDLDANPDWRAEYVRNTLGHVKGFELRDGIAWANVLITDPKDADAFRKAKFVSPRIDTDPVDSAGVKWPGKTIAHVGVTSKPVQHRQQPVALSSLAGQNRRAWAASVSHTLSEYKGSDVKKDDDAKDDVKDDAKPAAKDADDADAKPAEKPTDTPPKEPAKLSETPPKETTGALAETVRLLDVIGVKLGEGVADWDDFCSRLKAIAASMGKDMTDTDAQLPGKAGDGIEPGPSAPALMSGLEKTKATLIAAERRELTRRADALFSSNRIDGPTHRRLKNQIASDQLSFLDNGTLKKNETIITIEAYEKLPQGKYAVGGSGGKTMTSAELSALGVEPVNRPSKLAPDDESRQNAAAEFLAGKRK